MIETPFEAPHLSWASTTDDEHDHIIPVECHYKCHTLPRTRRSCIGTGTARTLASVLRLPLPMIRQTLRFSEDNWESYQTRSHPVPSLPRNPSSRSWWPDNALAAEASNLVAAKLEISRKSETLSIFYLEQGATCTIWDQPVVKSNFV